MDRVKSRQPANMNC